MLEFDLRVNAGVPAGTLISNQAVVRSNELPDLLTDGDGNPATGPEPTVVVVGDEQQLTITKPVTVVGGGPVLAGSTLEYVVHVTQRRVGAGLRRRDHRRSRRGHAGRLAYVAGSAMLNGSATGVTVAGTLITADYSGDVRPARAGRVRACCASARWSTPPRTAP